MHLRDRMRGSAITVSSEKRKREEEGTSISVKNLRVETWRGCQGGDERQTGRRGSIS